MLFFTKTYYYAYSRRKYLGLNRMPLLNFTKAKDAKPVAVVRGGDADGSVLYLHDGNKMPMTSEEGKRATPAPTLPTVRPEISFTKYAPMLSGTPREKTTTIARLNEAYARGIPANELVGESSEVKRMYESVLRDERDSKRIELPDDSTFQPIPDPDPKKRDIWYVAGISGSGKSYFARGICEAYKKLFPSREIYLISKLTEDETLDTMKIGKPARIRLDSLVEDPPSLEEFKDCLVVFDDYDTLSPPYDKVVQKLIDDLAIMGRHTGTSMLVLSHYLTNYKKTRLILGEAHSIVLYPMATSFKAMAYVCEHHCGLTKEEVHGLKKLGRWVMIHKTYPAYLISAHNAYVLHQ